MTYFWNVSLNGKFLFRTTEVMGAPESLAILRAILINAFPPSKGFVVSEYSQQDTWNSKDLT